MNRVTSIRHSLRRPHPLSISLYLSSTPSHCHLLPSQSQFQPPHTHIYTQSRSYNAKSFGSNMHGTLGLGAPSLHEVRPTLTHDKLAFPWSGNSHDIRELDGDYDSEYELWATGTVVAAASGWAHSAFIVGEPYPTLTGSTNFSNDDTNTSPAFVNSDVSNLTWTNRLYIIGRPHDFRTVMRLNRLPSIAVRFTNYIQQYLFDPKTTQAYLASMHPSPTIVPTFDIPPVGNIVACGAGVTAFVSAYEGILFTFGVNAYGQCGIGLETGNVWVSTPVIGLHSTLQEYMRTSSPSIEEMKTYAQEAPVVSVGLGLQHGVCCDELGNVYTWGKGERGQIGNGGYINVPHAVIVDFDKAIEKLENESVRMREAEVEAETDVVLFDGRESEKYDSKMVMVAAGMNHCACLSEDGDVWVWGKFMGRVDADAKKKEEDEESEESKDESDEDKEEEEVREEEEDAYQSVPRDALFPQLYRFPSSSSESTSKPTKIACSTHQTAILMNDGTVHLNGMYPGGNFASGARVRHDFVKVFDLRKVYNDYDSDDNDDSKDSDVKPTIELFGGFEITVVVNGIDAYTLTLGSKPTRVKWAEGKKELSKDGKRVRLVSTGWKHGIVLTDD